MHPPLMNPTTAFAELPAHWHRRHFDEVTSTMQLLHTDRSPTEKCSSSRPISKPAAMDR